MGGQDVELQRRGVRLSVPTLFKSAFRNAKLRATLNLEATFDNDVKYALGIKAGLDIEGLRFFSESIHYRNKKIMGRSQAGITIDGNTVNKSDIDPTRGLWDRFREHEGVAEPVRNELERMARYAIFAPQTAFLRGTEVESVLTQPMGLQGGGLAQAAIGVQKMMNSASRPKRHLANTVLSIISAPGWTSMFRVLQYDPTITTRLVKTGPTSLYFKDKYMKEKRNVFSAYDSSEGTLYLLFISILLLHPSAPRIFALDNVDSSLNPAITKKLIETIILCSCSPDFRSENLRPDQVFLTSHNPTSLDAIDIFDADQRVFVVKRDESGATVAKRLMPKAGSTRAEWIQLKQGKKLSELWINGLIDGALGI